MIEAKELRIGNWVFTEAYKNKVYSLKDGIVNGVCQSYVDPIPITEKRLEEFGFSYMGATYMAIDEFVLNDFTILREQDEFMFSYENASGDNIDIVLKYIHQLQNLFFALTGEELERKVK